RGSHAAHELVAKPTSERELVALGKPKLVRPKRKALDFAVRLLLRTPVPAYGNREPSADELAQLERNAVWIAKDIGLLRARHDAMRGTTSMSTTKDGTDPLWDWLFLAQTIRLMFKGRRPGTMYPVGTMRIHLACKSDGSCFMTVRPHTTHDALVY